MADPNKTLNVSYGSFSCTLDGFDDPLSAMKTIVAYFRDLAADDPLFGSKTPLPDPNDLAQLTARAINTPVQGSHTPDGGILLRPQVGAAEVASEQYDDVYDDMDGPIDSSQSETDMSPAQADVNIFAGPQNLDDEDDKPLQIKAQTSNLPDPENEPISFLNQKNSISQASPGARPPLQPSGKRLTVAEILAHSAASPVPTLTPLSVLFDDAETEGETHEGATDVQSPVDAVDDHVKEDENSLSPQAHVDDTKTPEHLPEKEVLAPNQDISPATPLTAEDADSVHANQDILASKEGDTYGGIYPQTVSSSDFLETDSLTRDFLALPETPMADKAPTQLTVEDKQEDGNALPLQSSEQEDTSEPLENVVLTSLKPAIQESPALDFDASIAEEAPKAVESNVDPVTDETPPTAAAEAAGTRLVKMKRDIFENAASKGTLEERIERARAIAQSGDQIPKDTATPSPLVLTNKLGEPAVERLMEQTETHFDEEESVDRRQKIDQLKGVVAATRADPDALEWEGDNAIDLEPYRADLDTATSRKDGDLPLTPLRLVASQRVDTTKEA